MPTNNLRPIASSSLSLPPETYIYSIIPTASNSLAAISSDDSLRVFNRETLRLIPGDFIQPAHEGVTCLQGVDDAGNIVSTAGRDGVIRFWDLRSGKKTGELNGVANNAPILALGCSAARNAVVAGTELDGGQAVVAIWDIRSPALPQIQYVESHNDDITEVLLPPSAPLQYYPLQSSLLLSGSTDGLVNIYSTDHTEEDDALYRVINHGSSIHHAGFLPDQNGDCNGIQDLSDVYALSHDEILSIYSIPHPDSQPDPDTQDTSAGEERPPIQFGDLRPKLAGEYIVNILMAGGGASGAMVAVGNHSEQRLDLVPLTKVTASLPSSSAQSWQFNLTSIARLPGAHGEDVVRDVFVDDNSQTVFTGGEDGHVRAWKP
ncbi:MAG: hypothetical protein M1837_006949 [Sclerophora amabilis]|nr:MAG: hypothetical protein M1837_006949 [Sclerophora amabilis]